MRILAVRGSNLASLTEFDIDLSSEPLAGAGLFAVTGDTGAGKSTILDALCLALFGEYPRAAVARAEKIEDPSGDIHTIQDSRNILRRGAASGHAEVDFIGRDGNGYRVRWEARRAKGKADGKLQKEFRRLDRLDGSAAVATGTRDVLALVEEKTGLTFDQFRRTVLLAQGEFDAFLIADEKARAELLEKITGTEIYRRLSQAAAAAAAERAADIERLKEKQGHLDLLDADTRARVEAAVSGGEAQLASLRTAHAAALAARARGERQTEARNRAIAASAAAKAAADEHDAAAPDRARLVLIDRLAPLDDKAAAVRLAEQHLATATTSFETADKTADAAALAAVAAAQRLQEVIDADAAAEAQLIAQEPLWREADALDRDLMAVTQTHAERQRIADEIAAARASAQAALDAACAETAAARAASASLDTDLAATAAHAMFVDRAADFNALLEKRAQLAATRDKILEEARRGVEDVQRLAAQAAADRAEAQALKAKHADITVRLEVQRAHLRAQDTGKLEPRALELADLESKLSLAADVVIGWRRTDDDGRAAEEGIESAATMLAAAIATRHEAEATLDRLGLARREVGRLADLAAATASEQAGSLRASLLPGQPCPVCGGSDHPYAHGNAVNALIGGVLARRDAIDGELERLTETIAQARGDAAAAEAQREAAEKMRTQAIEECTRLAASYAALVHELNAALASDEAPEPLERDITAADSDALIVLRDEVATAREDLVDQITRIAAARAAVDDLQTEANTIAATYDAVSQRAEKSAARHATADSSRVLTEAKARHANAELAGVKLALTPFLDAAGLSATDLDRDPAATRAVFKDLATTYTRRTSERAALEQRISAAAIADAAASSRLDALLAQQAAADADLAAMAAELTRRTAARAALLGGRTGDMLRAEAATARRLRASMCAEAESASTAAAIESVRQTTLRISAQAALAKAKSDLGTAKDTLQSALAAAGISDPQAIDVARLPADAVAMLRDRLARLDRIRLEMAATAAARRADLEAILADGEDPRPATELAGAVRTLDLEIEQLHQSIAAARARLAADDDARRRAGTLAQEIDAAITEYRTWEAVDAAIGSASGDKFRRFAQGVTLDHLVRLANVQLDLVAPRYRLVRTPRSGDLALAVVDRDMGDEVRAVRSLSGGERFLVSLALALALSGLEGRDALVDTLFIDEGFGALDAETLETAVAALEALHGQGRKVGVVTHVAAMIERIPVQIRVDKRGQGRSVVRILDESAAAA
jgi:exonuclease SbcC